MYVQLTYIQPQGQVHCTFRIIMRYESAINFAYWTSLRVRERKAHVKLQKILPSPIALA